MRVSSCACWTFTVIAAVNKWRADAAQKNRAMMRKFTACRLQVTPCHPSWVRWVLQRVPPCIGNIRLTRPDTPSVWTAYSYTQVMVIYLTWSSTFPRKLRLRVTSPSFWSMLNSWSLLPSMREYSTSELAPSSGSPARTVTTTWPDAARFHNTTSALSSLALFSPEVDVGVTGCKNTGALSFSSRI